MQAQRETLREVTERWRADTEILQAERHREVAGSETHKGKERVERDEDRGKEKKTETDKLERRV